MNKLKGFRLAAVIFTALFFGPSLLYAQRQATMSAAAHPASTVRVRSAAAPRVAVTRARGRVAAGTPANDPGNAFANGFGGFGSFGGSPLFGQQLLNSVPGFGNNANFDDLGIKAAIDPETQWRLAIAERFLRDNRGFGGFFGGGYILDGGGYYTVPEEPSSEPAAAAPAPQPQIIVVQAPGTNQQAGAPAPTAESEPPLPDIGQFTLVLRDGTKIEAVAFTRKSDTIVYITTDGSRRTLAVADLDSAATQRVNQERGTPLNLSL